MIPYFEQPALHLGLLSVHAFGVLTALALLLGLWLLRWRARRDELDEAMTERLGWYVLGFGFVGAHLYSVFAYFPHRLADDPWLLIRLWENISSTGGFLGGSRASGSPRSSCRTRPSDLRSTSCGWVTPATSR